MGESIRIGSRKKVPPFDWENPDITYDIEEVLGRKARDFTEYAGETAKAAVWDVEKHAL